MHVGVRFYEPGSSFKQAMLKMNGKTKIVAAQIAGDFTLPQDPEQKLVFIAGGIGITPFRSMLKYLIDTNQRRSITLIYGAKKPADFVYRDVLKEAQRNLGIKIVLVAQEAPPDWSGRQNLERRSVCRHCGTTLRTAVAEKLPAYQHPAPITRSVRSVPVSISESACCRVVF